MGAVAIGIVQAIITQVMNKIFRDVAIYATNRENHKTQEAYDNSLILKRFVFEFCDCFLYLFYIGFYSLNLKVLRTNLVSLFMVDEIRRVLTETLIPYLTTNSAKLKVKAER